ncbi:MAG: hypothetical protein QM495_06335 [Lutibacter sp.]|uniref:hypothetical protein n=1 Tax=Lutibacter sp. TaxID=1925666 RepID=UPI0038582E75
MPDNNDIIKAAIAGGLIGAALGALFTGKSERSLASLIAGAAIGASLKALEKAKDTNIPVLYEENGSIFRLHPDGTSEFVREIEQSKINIPEIFSLD